MIWNAQISSVTLRTVNFNRIKGRRTPSWRQWVKTGAVGPSLQGPHGISSSLVEVGLAAASSPLRSTALTDNVPAKNSPCHKQLLLSMSRRPRGFRTTRYPRDFAFRSLEKFSRSFWRLVKMRVIDICWFWSASRRPCPFSRDSSSGLFRSLLRLTAVTSVCLPVCILC